MRLAPPDEASRRRSLHAYYASVSFMDAQLGVLLDALEEAGLRRTTVIVLWSDHGYHLGDRSGLWGKRTLYERAARVPLVIAGAGVRQPGRASESLVELVDVYPTLLELSGLPARPELEGRSLRPILEDPAATLHEAAFTMMPGGRSVRTADWRYTEWGDGQAAELYDHRADPNERHNLARAPEHARTVAELQRLLRRHAAETGPVARN
jgi:arylsulfatase A-like enzyme